MSAASSVQIMVVEKFELRKVRQTGRRFVIGNIIESSEDIVKSCYVNDIETQACQDLMDLEARSKVVISSVSGKGSSSLRVLANAVVFAECVDFPINMEVVEGYIKPEMVSVSEARGSPQKRRLSVEGELIEVGPLNETEAYKRRVLKLGECGQPDHTIGLTVWGDNAAMEWSPGVCVTASAVIKQDGGLRTTASTKIEMKEDNWQQGTVVAVKRSRNHLDVMLDGNRCVRILQDLVVDLGPLLSRQIEFKFGEGNMVAAVKVVE